LIGSNQLANNFQRKKFQMRIGLIVLLFVSMVVSIGCGKTNGDANETKEPTNVVTPMNIPADINDDK
jgi:hypothetical protein